MGITPWTEERDAVLRRMAADKKSASIIAAALGCSRNAVIGRASRIGIHLLGNRYFSSAEWQAKRAKARALTTNINAKRARARRAAKSASFRPPGFPPLQFTERKPEPPPPEPIEYTGPGYLLLDIPFGGCRFYVSPIEDTPTLFCGLPQQEGCSYCPDHARMAVAKETTRVKRASVRAALYYANRFVALEAAE